MPRTSADQCPQSPKLDRIGNSTAEDWAIAGCANAVRARWGGRVCSGRLSIRAGQGSPILALLGT